MIPERYRWNGIVTPEQMANAIRFWVWTLLVGASAGLYYRLHQSGAEAGMLAVTLGLSAFLAWFMFRAWEKVES